MTRYTITPWRTQSDLLHVRQQLYPPQNEDEDSRRHAVDRVMAWKLRGDLPHAVESTALLIDAILHHDINTNSIFSIRAVYSAAFCRFVTGFCDIGRHRERSLEPSSMLDIAKQIDMPSEFVALRHEATHAELPSIQRLVTAARQALDWLWTVYWNRLTEPGIKTEDAASPEFKTEVATMLRDFRRSRRDALRNSAHESREQAAEIRTTCDALMQVCDARRRKVEALSNVLIEQRLLLPTTRELGSSLNGAFLIWDKLLKVLSAGVDGFGRSLVASICEGLGKPSIIQARNDVDKEALAKWLLHLVSSSVISQSEHASILVRIMRWCCLYPGYWSQQIGGELLKNCDNEFRADWMDLLTAASTKTDSHHAEDKVEGAVASLDGRGARYLGDVDGLPLDSHDDRRGGWKRALVANSTPIGVVR